MSESVAELLPGAGSVVPPGTVVVAVLIRLPAAAGSMVATTVKVAVPPTARLTRLLMLPLPFAGPEEPAPAYAAVQVALVMAAGKESATVAPVTKLGPALVTTMVYVVVPPGV